ncbi:glycosyltransferase [Sphingomonas sp.]|uniref:glycosyltransferase n=1 Tax=Sphingomonas sp. TaxID=28214 RepID=UPI003B0009F7
MYLQQSETPAVGKIAMFLPSLGGGGAEKSIVRLAVALSRQGIDVDLVLASATGSVLNDVSGKVRIVDLGRRRVAAALPGLVRYLMRERPAALLSAMHHANLIAIVAHAIARSTSRLVISERQSFAALQRTQRSLKERSLRGAMRLLYRRADAIVTVSKALSVELVAGLGLSRQRVFAIYNPVVSDGLLAKAGEPVDHPWLHQDVPVVLAVGRLVPEKGFDTLLEAMFLIRRHRAIRLVILGDGPLRRTLSDLAHRLGIDGDVDLAGYQSNPFSYMKHASVFVLSSTSEGLPSVLVEALAVGTCVVSTDCPTGPREILGEGSPALVPVGDPARMASAIMATLDGSHFAPAPSLHAFSEEAATAAYKNVLLDGVLPQLPTEIGVVA